MGRPVSVALLGSTAMAILLFSQAIVPAQQASVGPGDLLPPLEFRVLGSRVDAPRWHPADERGRRPVLFVYWLSGSDPSLELLREARGLMSELSEAGVKVVTVTTSNGMSDAEIAARAREMKLDHPVVIDQDFEFADSLGIVTVPAMTFVDRDGIVRVTQAVALRHEVMAGRPFDDYLRSGLSGGAWPTADEVPRYSRTMELIGARYNDFTLPDMQTLEPTSLSSLLSPDRATLLAFWAFNCAQCRAMILELAKYYEQEGKGRVNLVSVATTPDDVIRTRTLGFMDDNGLAFPVFLDGSREIYPAWKVDSIPAVMLIGADGTVRATAVGAIVDFRAMVAAAGQAKDAAVPPEARGGLTLP